ncbi:MAG TPA: ABC transporter substrate-binding protein [Patescibacteria group bacterium]|nr:ABC transporter substrate-binding protein [Patescibacteria group bacterium]
MTRGFHLFCFCTLLLLFSALAAERPVIYLRLTDSLTMDPGKIEDFYSQEVIFNVFEGLVRLGKDIVSVEPSLAERWVFKENGKRWIFYLRRGVKFHNGDKFDAKAVVYSFTKRMDRKQGEYAAFGRIFPYIAAVNALDDWTVEIVLSRPYFPFLFSLADMRGSVVAPGSYEGPEFRPIGTGPFVFGEWVRGKSLLLTRNDRYWQQPAKLTKIIFKSEPNAAIRLSQIKNRSADIDMIRSAKEYDELRDKTHIAILSKPIPLTYYLGFNSKRQPFSRLLARKAFFHLLNKRILIRHIFQNFAMPAAGFLPPQMAGFNPDIGKDDFSIKKAQRLLQESGLAEGFSCTLYYSEGQFGLEDVARAIVTSARRIKVNIKSVKLPFAKLLPAVHQGEPDLFLIGWGFTGDAGVFLNPLFMLYPGDKKNTMSASPEFVRLLAQAEETSNDKKRGELYAAAQRQLHEDLPLIPLFHLNYMLAYNMRLSGLHMSPFGFLIFKDVSIGSE